MDKKQNVLELRDRLDKTLAMPDLLNEESIRSLIKDQLLRASSSGNKSLSFASKFLLFSLVLVYVDGLSYRE